MKVCVISHAYIQEGYLPALEALAAQPGVELALVTPNRYPHPITGVPSVFSTSWTGCHVYHITCLGTRRQGAFLYRPFRLKDALRDFAPDIILHEQESFALSAAQVALVAALLHIPVVLFVWENLARALSWPRKLLLRYVAERTVGVIAGSTQAVVVHRGFGFKVPFVVLPQMGVARFESNPRLGRRNAGFLQVLFAGRLVADKGVDVLLRAVARLTQQRVAVQCQILGSGAEQESLASLCVQLGIAERVEFFGAVPMSVVAEKMKGGDVLVLPSRRTQKWEEQFGRILVEAFAQATVAVGSDTGAIPEVIGGKDLVFKEGDVDGLAAILSRLAQDEMFLRSEQLRLWERARHCYANEVVAQKKVDFLRSLQAEQQGRPERKEHV